MREIKFRGKRELQGEFVHGSLLMWGHDKTSIKTKKDLQYSVIDRTVGQYVGLEDVHGNEIYEGDIVKNKGFYGKIVFDELYQVFNLSMRLGGNKVHQIPTSEWFSREFNGVCFEIVGNIHDNPELLQDS